MGDSRKQRCEEGAGLLAGSPECVDVAYTPHHNMNTNYNNPEQDSSYIISYK